MKLHLFAHSTMIYIGLTMILLIGLQISTINYDLNSN